MKKQSSDSPFLNPHVHIPYDLFEKYLPFVRERRLNLELYFGSRSIGILSRDDIRALKDKLDYGPRLSIHAPFMDLSPGAVDLKVREVTRQRFSETLDIGEILRPEVMVFHSGYDKWKYNGHVKIWLEGCLDTWGEINKRAIDLGITIAIENIFEDEPHHLRMLAEEMGSENFGICFDTGHFNLFSKLSVREWVGIIRPYIKELHLHDNTKEQDEHLPLGDGEFDFKTLFDEIRGLDCVFTLEAHNLENARISLDRLREFAPRP